MNAGGTWYDFNDGLWDATQVMDLVAVPGNKIRAATHGKGVFESVLFSGTLPVDLIAFGGSRRESVNALYWRVSHESSMSHYELERSADGQRFDPVYMETSRSSTAEIVYTYDDPLGQMTAFSFYYRLKMVNLDGSFTYSDVILIRGNMNNQVMALENPFSDRLNLRYLTDEGGELRVSLLDAGGRLVKRQRSPVNAGSGIVPVNGLGHLPRGIYLLEVIINRQRYTQRLLRQ